MARKTNFRETLGHKRREMHDLANFIRTRAGETPNYSLLLGAGCSITSGIRSAGELVEEWREELYVKLAPGGLSGYSREAAIEYFSRECSQWYNASREYSSLFEKKFDLARQRRMFVESEVAGKLPSLGYAYLMHLIKNRYFNTVFTTNFDDLLNEAFHYFSDERPIVCAHDSSITSITVTSARPKIIKLHGDYLFDDIKSTQKETESLEQNTKKKFVEFCKDFGLVVVGYSGADRSIMDVLNGLLRNEEYLKNGIYWCIRNDDHEISEELERFLWRDRVYWVEVDGGFDELMAELYSRFLGNSLPIDTIMVSEKPRRIIERFCQNLLLSASPCGFVQGHLAKFRRELSKEQVVDAFRGLNDADQDRDPVEDSLRDDQTAKLLRIKRLMSLRELRQARQMLAEELSRSERDAFFIELSRLAFDIDLDLGELTSARAVAERLKEYDANNAEYLNMEYQTETKFDAKVQILRASIALEKYNIFATNELAETLLSHARHVIDKKRSELVNEGLDLYRRSIEMDGSIRNPAWIRLTRYLMSKVECSTPEVDEEIDALFARYGDINHRDRDLIRLKIERLSLDKSKRSSAAADALLAEILKTKETAPKFLIKRYELLRLRAFGAFRRRKQFVSMITQLELDDKYAKDASFNMHAARGFAGFGDYEQSLCFALKSFDSTPSSESALLVAATAEILGRPKVFDDNNERMIQHLSSDDLHDYKVHELNARGEYEKALKMIRARAASRDANELIVDETHGLLWTKLPEQAERLAKEVLEKASFSPYLGPLIVNYELARRECGKNPNRGRLGDLAKTSTEAEVKAAAYYLMGEYAKARNEFKEIFEDKPGRFAQIRLWYLFSDSAGKAFIDELSTSAVL